MTQHAADELRQRIDAIEEGYEYMLAYAGLGVPSENLTQSGSQIRDFVGRFERALDGLGALVRRLATEQGAEPADAYAELADALERDARIARATLRILLAQPAVSSQLVDNVNAMIHVRALLTDLFVIDELLGAAREEASNEISA